MQKQIRIFMFAAVLCELAGGSALEAGEYRVKSVASAEEYASPDAEVWNGVAKGIEFLDGASAWRQLSDRQTAFQAVYDQTSICFRFQANIPPGEKPIFKAGLKRDGEGFFDGEDLDLFLNLPDKEKSLAQFAFLPDGALYDSRNGDSRWNANKAEIKTSQSPTTWALTFTLPFASLEVDPPSSGTTWTFNVARTWLDKELKVHTSSWSKLKNNGYHSPEYFSRLSFVGSGGLQFDGFISCFDGNWIKNGGFNVDTNHGGVPDEWQAMDKSGFEYAEKTVLSGDYVVRAKHGGILLRQDLNRQVAAGDRLELSLLLSATHGKAGIEVTFILSDGTEVIEKPLWDQEAAGEWHAIKVPFKCPPQTVAIECLDLVQCSDSGDVAFDDVALKPWPKEDVLNLGQLPPLPKLIGKPLETDQGFQWAESLQKPMRVLFVMENDQFIKDRLVADFCRQCGFAYDLISDMKARIPAEVESRFLSNEYRAIFFVSFGSHELSRDASSPLLKAIENGVGAVFISSFGGNRPGNCIYERGKPYAANPPLDNLPLEEMSPIDQPALKHFGISAIYAGKMGKGRFMDIVCADRQFYRHGLLPAIDEIQLANDGMDIEETLGFDYWSYYYSLYGKCLRWAAQAGTPLRMEFVKDKPVDLAAGNPIQCRISNENSQATKISLCLNMFRDDQKIRALPTREISVEGHGTSQVEWEIPKETIGGRYFFNLQAKDATRNVLEWGTQCAQVAPVCGARLAAVEMKKRAYAPFDGVLFLVRVKGGTAPNLTIDASLTDAYKRKIWETRSEIKAGESIEVPFRANPMAKQIVAPYARLEVSLYLGKTCVDRMGKDVYFDIDRSQIFHDYVLSGYPWIPLHYWPATIDLMKQIGFNTVNCWPNGARRAAQGGMWWQDGWNGFVRHPELVGALQQRRSPVERPEDQHRRDECLSDPAWKSDLNDAIDWFIAVTEQNPPLSYAMTDEMTLAAPWESNPQAEPCRSAFSLEHYRKRLQSQYKTIEALNRQWDATYRNFDEIVPPFTPEARASRNFSAWVDFRLFMDDEMMGAGKAFSERITRDNPLIHSGQPNFCYEGPFTGIDPYKLAISRTGAQDYGNMDEFNRSFKNADTTVWNWSLYNYSSLTALHGELWQRVFHGSSGAACYDTWFTSEDHPTGYLHPLMGMTKRAEELREAVTDLVNGVGRLIINTPREKPPFAFHFSQPSMHMAWLESRDPVSFSWNLLKRQEADSYVNYFRSRNGFEMLVEDLQWQYDYRVDAQIAKGALDGYRVLVLPMSISIENGARQPIEAWQEEGGIVIADLRAGARDGHGKLSDPSWTERVFGIRCKSPPTYKLQRLATQSTDQISISNIRAQVAAGGALELKPGASCLAKMDDGIPAVVIFHRGKGYGIYLNFVAQYSPAVRQILWEVLKNLGIERPYRVARAANDSDALGYEVIPFRRDGDPMIYLGIGHSSGEGKGAWCGAAVNWEGLSPKEDVRIHLNENRIVYDVFERQSLGTTQDITFSFEPGAAKLFALAPTKETYLTIKAPSKVRIGEILETQVALGGKKNGYRVFRVEVLNPQGVSCPAHAKNVDAFDGQWNGAIPIALNDPLGEYILRVTDVVTRLKAERHFEVTR